MERSRPTLGWEYRNLTPNAAEERARAFQVDFSPWHLRSEAQMDLPYAIKPPRSLAFRRVCVPPLH